MGEAVTEAPSKTKAKPAAASKATSKEATGRRYRGVSESVRQAERRQRFIEAGLTTFGARGYHNTTVRSICSEAGLTERYFYESFQNSEDLLCVVYDHVVQRVRERVLSSLHDLPPDPVQISRAVLAAFLQCMRDDPRMARMLFVEVLGVSERVDTLYRATTEHFVQLLIRLSQPMLDPQELPAPLNPDVIATGLLGSVIMSVSRWVLLDFAESVETMVASLHVLFVAVVRHLAGEAGQRGGRT